MSITALRLEHEHAIRAFEQDFDQAGEPRIPAWFAERTWSHAERVERVNGWARGEFLQPGWIPCTTRFFQRGEALLGVVNVRHHLTDELRRFGGHVGYAVRPSARGRGVGTALLGAGLAVLADLGVHQALLTCDADNLPSVRIIEKHGGVEIDRLPQDGRTTVRFHVPVPRP